MSRSLGHCFSPADDDVDDDSNDDDADDFDDDSPAMGDGKDRFDDIRPIKNGDVEQQPSNQGQFFYGQMISVNSFSCLTHARFSTLAIM